jgi:hypothetical protein
VRSDAPAPVGRGNGVAGDLVGASRAAFTLGSDPRRARSAEVLALQRSIGNRAVTQLLRSGPRRLQREVRIDGGRKRVDEAYYKTGAGKSKGFRHSISALIDDPIRRVFETSGELENYADGIADYIGDVVTAAKGTYWFRLPVDKLTVLGEVHHNPDGNVEDVIRGLRTPRFMYEPFNELKPVKALDIPFTGTQAQLAVVNKGISISGFPAYGLFDPELENIVIKALTGTSIARNEYIAASKKDREGFKGRASTSDYSYGERVALYLSMAIHIAGDVAQHDFGKASKSETAFIKSARRLKDVYVKRKGVLDDFTKAKDGDELIGIYELTKDGNFASLPAIKEFTLAFHEYGARYIKQLGTESGDTVLEAEGEALVKKPGAGLDALGPAREAIMWQKIQGATGYLIIGMGDAHRVSLSKKLDDAGIPHARVDEELERQKKAIDAVWVP